MIFTNKQINEIIQSIRNLHWLFIAESLGVDLVPEDMVPVLKNIGFKEAEINSYPELLFQFGLLSSALKDKTVKDMTFNQLKSFVKRGKILPLTENERYMIKLIESRLTDSVIGLGNKVASDVRNILTEKELKNRGKYGEIIRKQIKHSLKTRQGQNELASELAMKTGDWNKDFSRISQFVLHEAFDNGRAAAILRSHDGNADEALVYKLVHHGACNVCNKLYNEYDNKEKKIKPKVFKLSELLGNGTNIGRKYNELKPIIGATHCWCRCNLLYVGDSTIYDFKEKRFRPQISDDARRLKLDKIISVEIKY